MSSPRLGPPRRAVAALHATALFAALAVGVGVATPHASALAPRMGLVSQTPYSAAVDSTITLVVAVPAGIDLTAMPDASLAVTAYRPIASRDAVAKALTGQLPRAVDHVDLPIAALPRPTATQLQVVVQLESTTRTTTALQLSKPGLYPVELELRSAGDVVAELLTFVHRLPGPADDPEDALPVAIAMSTTSPVVLGDDQQVVITARIMTEFTQLADLLDASTVPLAIRVPPALLAAIAGHGADGAALAQRLAAGLAKNDVLSSPSLPLDPSLAAAANQQALYTQWLRDGEDTLATAVTKPSLRTVVFAEGPMSEAGGALLRDLGGRLAVITPSEYDALPGTYGGYTDTTQLVQLRVANDATLDAVVLDRSLSRTLSRPTTASALTAIYAVTDLLATRQQIVDGDGDPRRHGVALGTPDLSLPPVETMRAIATLIDVTPGLRATTLDDLGVRMDQGVLNDQPVVVGLPGNVTGDLTARARTVRDLSLEAVSTSTMLPDGDARAAAWGQKIGRLPTSALTDDQVVAMSAELRAEYAAVRGAVGLPSAFSFTLTGRRTTVPIKLFNSSDTPLKVVVRMSSSKLVFPDEDLLVTLLPQTYTEVRVRIEARTNGRFPVTLQVLTPNKVEIAPAVPLTASVTALSGLGNLVTGALLLVVLTWWVRHLRQNRRNRAADHAASRHPVSRAGAMAATAGSATTGTGADHTTDAPAGSHAPTLEGAAPTGGDTHAPSGPAPALEDEALSPDAATSTLPPS